MPVVLFALCGGLALEVEERCFGRSIFAGSSKESCHCLNDYRINNGGISMPPGQVVTYEARFIRQIAAGRCLSKYPQVLC